MTEIGERGVTLSGGQRQRVSKHPQSQSHLYSEGAGEPTSTFKILAFLFHSFASRQGEPCKSLVCRCRHLPSRRSPLCGRRQSWSAHLQQVHPGEPSSLSSPVQSSKVMLKNKTVLLVTHGLQFLRQCDRVSFKSTKKEWTCNSISTIHRWFLWRMVKSQSKELTRSWWAKRLEWKNTQNYFNTFHLQPHRVAFLQAWPHSTPRGMLTKGTIKREAD